MQQPFLSQALVVGAVFFFAGLVKGVVGMGLPTTAMGLLGLLMPVPQAAALLTLPSFVTNVWQAFAGGALGLSGSLHSTIALAPALVGMFAGQQLRKRMTEAGFRRWFFGGLLVLGVWLVAR